MNREKQRHVVDLGTAYLTPDLAKIFTSYIAKSQRQGFLDTLSHNSTWFFSFLMDGTTDPGNQEDELFVVLYCFKDDEAQWVSVSVPMSISSHTPKSRCNGFDLMCEWCTTSFWHRWCFLNTDSVLCVEKSLLLVSGGTDGASVNVGVHTDMMVGPNATGLALAILVLVLHSQTRISLQGCFH